MTEQALGEEGITVSMSLNESRRWDFPVYGVNVILGEVQIIHPDPTVGTNGNLYVKAGEQATFPGAVGVKARGLATGATFFLDDHRRNLNAWGVR